MSLSEDSQSLHCCACDKLYHATWYEEEGRFEELCTECLRLAHVSIDNDPDDDISQHMELNGFEESYHE